MSRLVSVCAGLLLVSTLSGCCLFGHGYSPYGGGGGGYYGGGGCSPCQTGACGAVAPGYPSASLTAPQTAYMTPQQGAYAPQMVMTDPLSTF
jgi:hypothetical protein